MVNLVLRARNAVGIFNQASGGGAAEYSWDTSDPNYIVDPARTTNGTGSEASPFQPSQAFAVDPSGQQVIFEWLPGNLDFSDTAADYRGPRWAPQYSGALNNPIIHRTRYKAGDPNVSSSNYTSIRRTGGNGGILGPNGPSDSLKTDIYFDGFNIPTGAGVGPGDNTGSETFMYSAWNAARCKLVRARLDAQSNLVILEASNNYGGVWHQECDDCEVADTLVQNVGSTSGAQVWSGFEHYSVQGLNIHHCDIDNIRGQGIFEKGETGQQNLGNRYHHNNVRNVGGNNAAFFQYIHTTGLTLANASWWYQNVVYDCQAFFRSNYIGTAQTGVVVINNTVARMSNWGMFFNNHTHSPLWAVRNNIFFNPIYSYYPEDGSGWTSYASGIDVDRNRHYAGTGIMRNDGSRTLDYVRTNYGVDVNGQESDPGFTDAAANDFRRTFDQLGTDYLGLLGGSTSAAINQGAYILSDMSDRIGRRF